MTEKRREKDPMGYRKLIERAFPGALVTHQQNFDDFWLGWDIAPEPTHAIRFSVAAKDEMYVSIYRKSVSFHSDTEQPTKRIFSGVVPANGNNEPDDDFIVQLLKNYKSIG